MNSLYKIYCRTFQTVLHLALPLLPYREPKLYNDINDIITCLKTNNIHNILLVTDKGLRASGNTFRLEDLLIKNNIDLTIYDETKANPTVDNVEEALSLYHKQHCQGLIAFGGGSSMDLAKAIGARVVYPNKSINQLKGLLKVLRKLPILIAIPTTAGTGSEVTITSVITDNHTKHKYTINSFTLIPDYALLDPCVTYSLPPLLTATCGMDALCHAVEAYIGNSTSKQTRQLALNATKLIFENIQIAYDDPCNYEARSNMLMASYQAGIAFSKSYVGYIHAIAHSLGGQYNVAHGHANAIIMPMVLEAYGTCIYDKLKDLAIVSKVAKPSDTSEVAAKKFINAIKALNTYMHIPAIKVVKEEDIDIMATHAAKEANPLYPVPKLMDKDELKKFYYQLME